MPYTRQDYQALAEQLTRRGMDVDAIKDALKAQKIETPSWGYADSGTRFKVFNQAGAARTLEEKLADAAAGAQATPASPPLWRCTSPGTRLTTMPPAQALCRQSWASSWAPSTPTCSRMTRTSSAACATPMPPCAGRRVDHMSGMHRDRQDRRLQNISLWLADGTNYPGQDNMRQRQASSGWRRCRPSLCRHARAHAPADRVQVL